MNFLRKRSGHNWKIMKGEKATASEEREDSKIQVLEKVAEEWRKERIRNNLIIAGKVFEKEREKEEAKEWFKEKLEEDVEVKEVRK